MAALAAEAATLTGWRPSPAGRSRLGSPFAGCRGGVPAWHRGASPGSPVRRDASGRTRSGDHGSGCEGGARSTGASHALVVLRELDTGADRMDLGGNDLDRDLDGGSDGRFGGLGLWAGGNGCGWGRWNGVWIACGGFCRGFRWSSGSTSRKALSSARSRPGRAAAMLCQPVRLRRD